MRRPHKDINLLGYETTNPREGRIMQIIDTLRIDWDERGPELTLETDEGDVTYLIGDWMEFWLVIDKELGAWYREGQAAAREYRAHAHVEDLGGGGGGYELDDPKHPTYYDRMSAAYDEGRSR
jgi:hypothetical protein